MALPILITPPWWRTNWFRALCAAVFRALLWAAYQFRIRQPQREFDMRLEWRVEERMRIARELHDTLLQSFQGLMISFQAARNLLPGRTEDAIRTLDKAIRAGDYAIAEGRRGYHSMPAGKPAGGERSRASAHRSRKGTSEIFQCGGARAPDFRISVEGAHQPLSPILQDEVYRIAREIVRNAFHHAHASRIEAEVAYDSQFFRLRIRDNGKGIDPTVLEAGARQGHWGIAGDPRARETSRSAVETLERTWCGHRSGV